MDELSINADVCLEGTVEEIVFYSNDTGYAVIYLDVFGEYISIAGNLPFISEGESVAVYGSWYEHPKYGRQLNALYYEPKIVLDAQGAYKYLSGGIIKGIGPITAKKIVDKFGDETFYIMEHDYDKLIKINGITPKKARLIHEEYMKKIELQNVVTFFNQYEVSPAVAVKVYNTFGNMSVSICKKNPYILCERVERIGFPTADKLAKKMGFSDDAPERINAGIIYTLNNAALSGHTCLPNDILIQNTAVTLNIGEKSADDQITRLLAEKRLVLNNINGTTYISLPMYYEAESYIALRLEALKKVKVDDLSKKVRISDICEIELAQNQKEAVCEALRNNLLIITGGPGTGKTTVIKTIISAFEKLNKKVILAAPTGRAAKRISELTRKNAKTIHRLLELTYHKNQKPEFEKNAQNPLICDVVIVDEMSMTDTLLFQALLCALKESTRIIMVGDCDQLPPVGAGNVLKDLIMTKAIKRITFDEIFRQNENSQIVTNAHRILKGDILEYNGKNSDFFFMASTETQETKNLINELLTKRLPKFLNTTPDKIQVLTPMRKTSLGSVELNKSIKTVVNPIKKGDITKNANGYSFSVGDRVMQTKNDYDVVWKSKYESGEGIYNGDMGIITAINNKNSAMTILFDDEKTVEYEFSRLENLELSYAITVHKSQGSEFDAVIIPLVYGYEQLMSRNLLYTAITRAKKFVCIVGTKACVEKMIANDIEFKRYTLLKEFFNSDD